eukprot:TRINITY_DN324_c0_g2_i2.p1 TRINITY_DN324_c0_g2~~TRINITY_DN324_c0_g2_i2.p1  ORF type:complete len:788 (+),score=193.91 TRINITY_DN324_c0_g2_i2:208-2571(+)
MSLRSVRTRKPPSTVVDTLKAGSDEQEPIQFDEQKNGSMGGTFEIGMNPLNEDAAPESPDTDPGADEKGPSPHATGEPSRLVAAKTWLFSRTHNENLKITDRRRILAVTMPVAISFLLSMAIGFPLNERYFGTINGGTNDVGHTMNVCAIVAVTSCVCTVLSVIRFYSKYYIHRRAYGVYSFLVYCGIMLAFLSTLYAGDVTAATSTHAHDMSMQLQSVLEDTWLDDETKTPASWRDINRLDDVYNWLKVPFGSIVKSEDLINKWYSTGVAPEGQLLNLPTQYANVSTQDKYALWKVLFCRIKQLRVKLEPIDELSVDFAEPIGRRTFNYKVPVFSKDKIDESIRVDPTTGLPLETFWGKHYHTWYGKTLNSVDYIGRRELGIDYPGAAGQGMGGYLNQGLWSPGYGNLTADYDGDIAKMISSQWIDAQTSLMQASCGIVNPNFNFVMYFYYSVEFLPSGRLLPSYPYVTVDFFGPQHTDLFNLPLLMSLYYLSVELQDIAIDFGSGSYFLIEGWLNVVDWLAIASSLWVFVSEMVFQGSRPSFQHDHINSWNLAHAQVEYQQAIAMCCFMYIFKGLHFTRNIPILCDIGSTFSASVADMAGFFVCMLVLMIGFAMAFHVMFCTSLEGYGNFQYSLLNSFRALLGDVDTDGLLTYKPVWGPIVYVAFTIMIFLVGTTILVAIITRYYEAVKKDPPPSQGVVVEAYFAAMTRLEERRKRMQAEAKAAAAEDEEEDPEVGGTKEGSAPEEEEKGTVDLEAVVAMIARLEAKIDRMGSNQPAAGEATVLI